MILSSLENQNLKTVNSQEVVCSKLSIMSLNTRGICPSWDDNELEIMRLKDTETGSANRGFPAGMGICRVLIISYNHLFHPKKTICFAQSLFPVP